MKAWIWQNKNFLIQNDGLTVVTFAHDTHGTADNNWYMSSSMSYLEETFKAKQVHAAVMAGCQRRNWGLFLGIISFVAAWTVPILVWNNERQSGVCCCCVLFFLLLEMGSCFSSPDWPGTHFSPAQAGTQATVTMPSWGSWIDVSFDVSLSPRKKLGHLYKWFFPTLNLKAVLPSLRHNCKDCDHQSGLPEGLRWIGLVGAHFCLPILVWFSCVRRPRAPLLVGRVSVQSCSLRCRPGWSAARVLRERGMGVAASGLGVVLMKHFEIFFG